jgi:hypothetical protein
MATFGDVCGSLAAADHKDESRLQFGASEQM